MTAFAGPCGVGRVAGTLWRRSSCRGAGGPDAGPCGQLEGRLAPLRGRGWCLGPRSAGARRGVVTGVAAADVVQAERKAVSVDGPTSFERICAALMYVLPLSEGIYRLALVSVKYLKHCALEFCFWCNFQHHTVAMALSSRVATEYTKEDMVALQTLLQMSRRFYSWLAQWADQLLNLSVPSTNLQPTTPLGSWASSMSTPDALWHQSFLYSMTIVAGLAGHRLDKRWRRRKPEKSRWFCKPELLSVGYFCTLLLRLSWVPLEGMSELSLGLYRLGATLLTLITTVGAATQVQRLLCGQPFKLQQMLEDMVEQATSVAHLHRTFLLLDWLLCLFSQLPLSTKCLSSFLLLVYWMAISALQAEAEAAKQLPIAR
eukprot:evm.model.scf_281.2 EVM.evm.TU.scf_281.2   scf_281:23805-27202(+)